MILVFARPQPTVTPKPPAPGQCCLCPASRPRLGTVAVRSTNKRVCEACRDEFVSLYHLAAEVVA